MGVWYIYDPFRVVAPVFPLPPPPFFSEVTKSEGTPPRGAGCLSPPAGPAAPAVVRRSWNQQVFTTIAVIMTNDYHQTPQNSTPNAIKYLFCCVHHFIASIHRPSPLPNSILTSGGTSSAPGGARLSTDINAFASACCLFAVWQVSALHSVWNFSRRSARRLYAFSPSLPFR